MGAILGLGVTHVPLLAGRDEDMARILRRVLEDPELPESYRTPDGWPEAMRHEWGDDEGLGAARRHREALLTWFRKARRVLDDFAPDLVVIWGDDQYENFKEDIIPPFCVLAYESIEHQPWASARWPNVWNEPKDTAFVYQGHREAGKILTEGLIEAGFDLSYAYRPLHHPLGHAFMNTLLFLDYDRRGFPYPVIPFQVNCYGRRVIAQHGGLGKIAGMSDDQFDPPSPSPCSLLRSRPRDRDGHGGQSVARRLDRVVELVPCVPDAEASPALPGRRGRPGDVRVAARRRLSGVAAHLARRDRG